MVTTFGSFSFTYGEVEVVAKLPKGDQFWPAMWMLPANQSPLPEVDIAETASSDPESLGMFLHTATSPTQGGTFSTPNLTAGWNTFGLDWSPNSITWYVDGQPKFVTTTSIPDVAMYLLINLATTNSNPSCLTTDPAPDCSGSLLVKSVKVWQS